MFLKSNFSFKPIRQIFSLIMQSLNFYDPTITQLPRSASDFRHNCRREIFTSGGQVVILNQLRSLAYLSYYF